MCRRVRAAMTCFQKQKKWRMSAMINELVLSAEELFFLGKLMNGKHLNYQYVAAMEDIQRNQAEYEQRCRNHLCDKGILHENLWGDMEIDKDVVQFLKPVYEGDFEASVEVIHTGENATIQTVLLHSVDEKCLMSIQSNRKIKLSRANKEKIDSLIFALMPDGYNRRPKPDYDCFKNMKIRKMIIFKNISIGKNASAGVFYDCNGWLCEQTTEGQYLVLSPKQFYEKASLLLKGAYSNGIL